MWNGTHWRRLVRSGRPCSKRRPPRRRRPRCWRTRRRSPWWTCRSRRTSTFKEHNLCQIKSRCIRRHFSLDRVPQLVDGGPGWVVVAGDCACVRWRGSDAVLVARGVPADVGGLGVGHLGLREWLLGDFFLKKILLIILTSWLFHKCAQKYF